MAKQGMKRPGSDGEKARHYQDTAQIQGKARHGKEKANPVIAGTKAPSLKVYHSEPHGDTSDKPISDVYSAIDNDLARDNLENDITFADLQDLDR